jgi:hypothetical protein
VTPARTATTLADRIVSGPLEIREVVALAADLGAALRALHRSGDVHGGVRPEQVQLAADGRASLARAGEPTAAPVPEDAASLRRAAYAAPEVLRGRRGGAAADLFALGVVLHEALAGAHPFAADGALETARRILHERPRPARWARPEVPGALAAVVDGLLHPTPWRRPSARKVAEVAARVAAAGEAPAAPHPGPLPAAWGEGDPTSTSEIRTSTPIPDPAASSSPSANASQTPVPIPYRLRRLDRFRARFRANRGWRRPHLRSRRRLVAAAVALLLSALAVRAAWRHHRDGALASEVAERLDARDLAGAQRVLREAERRRPGDALVARLQGDLALARGDERRALRLWRSALAVDRSLGRDPRLRREALSLLDASEGRADLVAVLAALDREVVDPLLAATRSPDGRVRWSAVRALEARGEAARVDYAQVYLADLEHGGSCTARRAAAAKLAWLRSPAALPGLERARASMGLFDRLCMGDAVDRAIDATRRGPPRA